MPDDKPAPISSDLYLDPDGAIVFKGGLVPGANLVQALVARLKSDIATDAELKAAWDADPRSVLADRGIMRDLQNEILADEGIPVPQMTCIISCLITVSDKRLKRDMSPVIWD